MSEENSKQDPFKEARGIYERNNYSGAVVAYQNALSAFEKGGNQANDPDAKLSLIEGYKSIANSSSSAWMYQDAFNYYFKAKEVLAPDGRTETPEGTIELAEVYTGLGDALYSLSRYPDAISHYEKAEEISRHHASKARSDYEKLSNKEIQATRLEAKAKLESAEESYADRCNDLGSAYLNFRKYDTAIKWFQVAIEKSAEYPYAHHNLASAFQTQGRYRNARTEWGKARSLYRKWSAMATTEGWIGHFLNFGTLLHEVFGEFALAAEAYEEGLKLHQRAGQVNEIHIDILISQVALYLEMMEVYPNERNLNNLAARKAHGQARDLLDNILRKTRPLPEIETLLTMGELALTMNEYEDATKLLNEAYLKDEGATDPCVRSARPATDLGVLCMRRKAFKEAIDYFVTADKVEGNDLSIMSNLAEAYLNDGQYEEAEKQFQRVLDIAPDHVESRIGMAGVYTSLGENGDPDMYDAAISQYSQAIKMAERNTGSKRLKKKEQAAVLYSRGYARVKFCEASKGTDRSLLHDARVDFNKCLKMDPEQHKAKRAVEKINKVLPRRSPQGLLEKWGPLVILASSSFVFVLSQVGFVWSFMDKSQELPWWLGVLDKAQRLTVNEYIALTFGSLLLMVASCYLPQLLKLKVPGIELEKAVVDQITFVGTVGISKQ